ncbi:hypothetical protein GCM10027570_05990 [Streptomonospora sediminis]
MRGSGREQQTADIHHLLAEETPRSRRTQHALRPPSPARSPTCSTHADNGAQRALRRIDAL